MDEKVKDKHFWCTVDSKHWATDDYCTPGQSGEELADTGSDDPFNFYSRCPVCKAWSRCVPHHYANLEKMRSSATGPRTIDGKNRSSVNGIKTGVYAQPHHLLAPANGKYDICHECDIKEQCENKELRYCPYKQDLMVRFMAAVENGNVNELKQYAGLSQGRLYIVLENMFEDIMKHGPTIKQPKVNAGKVVQMETGEFDENDEPKTVILYEYVEHPLLDDIPRVMQTLGMTSDQQKMNPDKQDNSGEDAPGNMKPLSDPTNFLKSMTELVNAVRNGIAPNLAAAARSADPVFQDITREEGEEEEVDVSGAENPFKR